MSLLTGDSIDRRAKLFKRSWWITDLRYVLINLSLEKLLSPEATVTGIVSNILRAVNKLGNAVDLSLQARYCNSSLGFCYWVGSTDFIISISSESM